MKLSLKNFYHACQMYSVHHTKYILFKTVQPYHKIARFKEISKNDQIFLEV